MCYSKEHTRGGSLPEYVGSKTKYGLLAIDAVMYWLNFRSAILIGAVCASYPDLKLQAYAQHVLLKENSPGWGQCRRVALLRTAGDMSSDMNDYNAGANTECSEKLVRNYARVCVVCIR